VQAGQALSVCCRLQWSNSQQLPSLSSERKERAWAVGRRGQGAPSSWQRIRLAHPPVEPRIPVAAGNGQGHPGLGKDPRAPLVPERDGGTMT
jgi:hypothetical protein